MADYWTKPDLGGGSITGDIMSNIKTPIKDEIYIQGTNGLFHIPVFKMSSQSNEYLNIWMLSTNPTDSQESKLLSSIVNEDMQCCFTDNNFKSALNGFVRIINTVMSN